MARALFVVGFVVGAAAMLVAGAALQLHADEPNRDVREAAAAAGYDEREFTAALATLSDAGLPSDPWTYARFEGRLPPLPPSVSASPAAPTSGVWARLAACESSSIWSRNSGNGYFGGLQEDMTFWLRYGGLAYAPRPDLASPAAQVIVAERGLAVQGFGAWPRCSRMLGLR